MGGHMNRKSPGAQSVTDTNQSGISIGLEETVRDTTYFDGLSHELIYAEKRCAKIREKMSLYHKNPKAHEDMFSIDRNDY